VPYTSAFPKRIVCKLTIELMLITFHWTLWSFFFSTGQAGPSNPLYAALVEVTELHDKVMEQTVSPAKLAGLQGMERNQLPSHSLAAAEQFLNFLEYKIIWLQFTRRKWACHESHRPHLQIGGPWWLIHNESIPAFTGRQSFHWFKQPHILSLGYTLICPHLPIHCRTFYTVIKLQWTAVQR